MKNRKDPKIELICQRRRNQPSALKRSGVAKAVNRKTFDLDQLTEESEVISEDITENSDIAYVIKYVGVVYTKNCVLKCYPKYINNCSLLREWNLHQLPRSYRDQW
ncbi:hypothetical protein [Fibrobacter sp. UWH3]|uniref:hypothetical protein n=1 Tax=Fibrobacter sp. UWH3 TaxID=1964353 RepID=UPI00092075F6|nr:hypothetical protein [Fibrobacter sp. UWH3]SHL38883.1 hypothetical protein SAMN05720765_1144 [Fibrobacter sp. UWH6]